MERAESNTPNTRTKLRRRPVLQARRKNQVVAAARLRWLWGRRDGRDDLQGRRRGGGNRIGKHGAGRALALVGGRNLCGRLLRRHELREGAQKLACHGHRSTTKVRRSGRRIPARRCRARRRGGRRAKEGVHEGCGMMMVVVVVRIRLLLLLLLLLQRPGGLQQQRVLRQQLRRVGRHGNRREQAGRGGRRRKPRRGVLVPAGHRRPPPRRRLAFSSDRRVPSISSHWSVSHGGRGLERPAAWRISLRHVECGLGRTCS
jgi:hypothetical protein